MTFAWRSMKEFVVHRILHADDTPHRIALGVAIGLFVAFTPTIGIQMVIGAVLATMLRANKIPAIGLAWITNPFTIVPVFYFNWCVGHALLFREIEPDTEVRNTIAATVAEVGGFQAAIGQIFDGSFWSKLSGPLGAIAGELVVGSLLVSTVAGLSGYLLTYRGVRRYRERRHAAERTRETLKMQSGTVAHEPTAKPTRNSA
jgi:hypothetical protein